MLSYLDVLLRGALYAAVCLAAGGVVWSQLVLGVSARGTLHGAARIALTTVARAAWSAAALQAAVMVMVLANLGGASAALPVGAYLDTSFARAVMLRVTLSLLLGVLALRCSQRSMTAATSFGLTTLAVGLVVSGASVSHAAARLDNRTVLMSLDALHQLAVAIWIGGLAHLVLYGMWIRRHPDSESEGVAQRFSSLAVGAMATLILTGIMLTYFYVAGVAALLGTAYGIMVLSKIGLLLAALTLAFVNFRRVHGSRADTDRRFFSFVGAELGLAVTVLFATSSLTSLPPAVDAGADQVALAELAERFSLRWPSFTTPRITDMPVDDPAAPRTAEDRAWSEFNHHVAGLFVLAMGCLALAHASGRARWARHWPLLLLALAAFLFVRDDPGAWPLGPQGFWASMASPDVLQHRAFVLIVIAFGIFEWMVRSGRLSRSPWSYVFPSLCAVGGGLLLLHSHALANVKEEFLVEAQHMPLALLGVFAGWSRWLEVRLAEGKRAPRWLWPICFVGVGMLLLAYRES